MLNEVRDILQCYQDLRGILFRDLRSATAELIDWRILSQAVTIGSTLVHITGLEYLIISAIQGYNVHEVWQNMDWEKYRSGFPRELHSKIIKGQPLSYYLELLREVEEKTEQTCRALTASCLERKVFFYREGKEFIAEELESISIRRLLMGLLQHEQYHRGQIMFLKFLFLQQQ